MSTANRRGPAETSAQSGASYDYDTEEGLDTANRGGPAETSAASEAFRASQPGIRHGMVLPFQPVTLTFRDVHYSVDLPAVRSQASNARLTSRPCLKCGTAATPHHSGGRDVVTCQSEHSHEAW